MAMMCTFSLCRSVNTKLIQRTCKIVFDATEPEVSKETIRDCTIGELWLCKTCGNPFVPAVSRVMPWQMRILKYKTPSRPFRSERCRVAKSDIIKELFRKEN